MHGLANGEIRNDAKGMDVYQSVEGLRSAMPDYTGDWYFTGRYPTPGGHRVLTNSYLHWGRRYEGRAYENECPPPDQAEHLTLEDEAIRAGS